MEIPPIDSVIPGVDRVRHVFYTDIWGRSEDDVYAVGLLGAILHFDGTRWNAEPNPLHELARLGPPESLLSGLWGVGGNDSAVYAAGPHVLTRRHGQWEEVLGFSRARAVAAIGRRVLVGGFRRIYLADDSAVVLHELPSFPGDISAGTTQPGGAALFWSYRPPAVAEVTRDGANVYRFRGIATMRGAAASGCYLFVGANAENRGLVLRIQRARC
jgi:hypothetical protein